MAILPAGAHLDRNRSGRAALGLTLRWIVSLSALALGVLADVLLIYAFKRGEIDSPMAFSWLAGVLAVALGIASIVPRKRAGAPTALFGVVAILLGCLNWIGSFAAIFVMSYNNGIL